jgi:hypothetical protein
VTGFDAGFDFPFGSTRAEAAAKRAACCAGERCTLCNAPANHKVEEDTWGEHRHPLTAYVCGDCFNRIFCPYLFKPEST